MIRKELVRDFLCRVKSALASEMGSYKESSLQKVVVDVWSRWENMNEGVCRKEDE